MLNIRKTEAGLFAVDVDGHQYEFEKWGAEDGLDTLLDITKITGKSLGLAVGGLFAEKPEDGEAKKLSPDLIGQIMEALIQGIGDKKTAKELVKKFASERCFCEGAKVVFNSHYKDRYDHLFKVVRAGLEVQYGNFLGALLGSAGISMPKAVMNRVL